LPAGLQKEVTMLTVTLGSALSKPVDGPNLLSSLIVCMILVMIVMAKLFGGIIAPFREVIRAAFAVVGALLLAGLLILMLVTALMMSV
jgi:hypothetical protein